MNKNRNLSRVLFLLFLFSVADIFGKDMSLSPGGPDDFPRIRIETFTGLPMMVKDDIRHHSYLNIAGQTVVGEAIACGFSFLPLCGLVGSSFSTSDPTAPDIFGGLSIGAYVIGTATGLYWVAKAQNNSLSYWKVTEYSLIGAGVGATILGLSSIQNPTIPEGHVAVALLCPLISAMIYTNCVAEWPK